MYQKSVTSGPQSRRGLCSTHVYSNCRVFSCVTIEELYRVISTSPLKLQVYRVHIDFHYLYAKEKTEACILYDSIIICNLQQFRIIAIDTIAISKIIEKTSELNSKQVNKKTHITFFHLNQPFTFCIVFI